MTNETEWQSVPVTEEMVRACATWINPKLLPEMHELARGALKAALAAAPRRDDVLRKVRCPDNVGGIHRWDGDGQCKDCCNYATDLIDRALTK